MPVVRKKNANARPSDRNWNGNARSGRRSRLPAGRNNESSGGIEAEQARQRREAEERQRQEQALAAEEQRLRQEQREQLAANQWWGQMPAAQFQELRDAP